MPTQPDRLSLLRAKYRNMIGEAPNYPSLSKGLADRRTRKGISDFGRPLTVAGVTRKGRPDLCRVERHQGWPQGLIADVKKHPAR